MVCPGTLRFGRAWNAVRLARTWGDTEGWRGCLSLGLYTAIFTFWIGFLLRRLLKLEYEAQKAQVLYSNLSQSRTRRTRKKNKWFLYTDFGTDVAVNHQTRPGNQVNCEKNEYLGRHTTTYQKLTKITNELWQNQWRALKFMVVAEDTAEAMNTRWTT